MEEKKYIRNFVRFDNFEFDNFEPEDKIKIIKDDTGAELGFELAGTLTAFDVKNENGLIFSRGSYDNFVARYYEGRQYNIPVCLLHDDTDPRSLCGIVRTLEKNENEIKIVVYIPRSAYYYNLIKEQVRNGILQGFSNCGFLRSTEWNEDADGIEVMDFDILHVALVATPADVYANFENTIFKGFSQPATVEDNPDALNYLF